jgi:hypothetical protein
VKLWKTILDNKPAAIIGFIVGGLIELIFRPLSYLLEVILK